MRQVENGREEGREMNSSTQTVRWVEGGGREGGSGGLEGGGRE